MKDDLVKCTKCRNEHKHSDRIKGEDKKKYNFPVFDLLCPFCSHKNFRVLKEK